ncbi:protein AF1q [Ambystoma mexicanum]|uniref:protein AF1q n=1 Tax=Ambystoma mexicanum TaxID=8296 RepID=UPI0037E8E3EA
MHGCVGVCPVDAATLVASEITAGTKSTMLDTVNTQYNSYVFWKLPIPELDLSELEGLGIKCPRSSLKPGSIDKRSEGPGYGDRGRRGEEDNLAQYNSFNYWRAPIASVDFDFL